jgi:diguanylate cyclase
MIPPKSKHLSTLAIAKTAMGQIAAHGQSADPRSYELWYKFATGDSGLLCAAVNSRLERNGTLRATDVDELYGAHIAPTDSSTRMHKLGARAADDIERLMAMIEAAEDSASDYSDNLNKVSARLGAASDRESVRAVVEGLVRATKVAEVTNLKLQDQLQAMWEEVSQLRKDLETVRTEGTTDALTSLGNRKFFHAALEKLVAEAHAKTTPLALLLADVDGFRAINGKFGHIVGDRILRFVANTFKSTLTGNDIPARYGGASFAVIMPRTPLRAAVEVADQLRIAVMKGELVRRSTGEKQSRVTLSIGVAALHSRTTPQALIEAADVCLHAARRSGGNCVVGERDEKLLTAVAG